MSSNKKVNYRTELQVRTILVPVDGSPNSQVAAKVAINLAKSYKAKIIFLNVISASKFSYGAGSVLGTAAVALDTYYEYAESKGENLIDDMIQLARTDQVSATGEVVKSTESTVQSIVEQARDSEVDMIVIGTRGLSTFKKMLIGSVSSGVVTYSHCPVLVVR